MNADEARQWTRDRARRLYERGVCPGCGADLVDVAGQGDRHYQGGQLLWSNPARVTVAGELAGRGVISSDPRLCIWDADQLAALVHIGSGLVS